MILNNNFVEAIDIIFRRISPERIKDSIIAQYTNNHAERLSIKKISYSAFHRYAIIGVGKHLTDSEILNIYELISSSCFSSGGNIPENYFRLLAKYGDSTLNTNCIEINYNKKETSRWREVSLRLGQDLFVTSALAFRDFQKNLMRLDFSWNPVLESDNSSLISRKKIAENHFHLYGSTSIFHLSWICMMNHPENCITLGKELESNKFSDNLNPDSLLNSHDYQMSWADRLRLAAWLRLVLFMRICGNFTENQTGYDQMVDFLNSTGRQNQIVCDLAEFARKNFGEYFPLSTGLKRPLDYAFLTINHLQNIGYTDHDAKRFMEINGGLHRLFVGERFFLYNCFLFCYNNQFNDEEKNLFYLYILLKERFRSELIQVNNRPGFQNFANYQNRKSMFFNNYREYNAESVRLAINRNIEDNHLNSLENRIMPSNAYSDVINSIARVDIEVIFAWEEEQARNGIPVELNVGIPLSCRKRLDNMMTKMNSEEKDYFFVIHFPKKSDKSIPSNCNEWTIPLRNSVVRKSAKHQALTIAKTLNANPYVRSRIRGFDACSLENHCRPETFATEFRFLQSLQNPKDFSNYNLGITYHVGEDFDDLTSGVRAIDEAILFLNLKSKDRLGHAMALGVYPDYYYSAKEGYQCISKQDRLDDIIWLLHRSQELGIKKSFGKNSLMAALSKEAECLYRDIYGDSYFEMDQHGSPSQNMRLYFEAWKCRGDHPELYRNWSLNDLKRREYSTIDALPGGALSMKNQYELQRKIKTNNVFSSVFSPVDEEIICDLVHQYHFNPSVRKKGAQKCIFEITKGYRKLLFDIQEKLIDSIYEKDIRIECNPSSNVLIGVFDKYEDHPIFRFIQKGLNVSINTDDQGVFDTSLVNEYTLIQYGFEKRHGKNRKKTKAFLDTLLKNSQDQIFLK